MHDYFYEQFPQELLGYWQEHQAPQTDGILTHRGAVVLEVKDGVEHYLLEGAEDRFRFSWYGAAFLDWGLRTCFPERFEEWLSKTGGSPYPVRVESGNVEMLEPHRILDEREETVEEWRKFCAISFDEFASYLKIILGMDPKEFFEKVLRCEDFDFTSNLFDEEMADAAVKKFGIEGVFGV